MIYRCTGTQVFMWVYRYTGVQVHRYIDRYYLQGTYTGVIYMTGLVG